MSETGRTIECGDCGKSLDEPTDQAISERKPCPDCGSFRRHVRIAFSGTMTFREKMKLKVKNPEGGKPKYESLQGDDLHRKSDKWMKKERIIDRENNWYKEVVINPETGEIIHKTEEPLSEHRGHGSAKKKKDNQ